MKKSALNALPPEIHLQIFNHLSAIPSTCLGLTSKHYYAIHRTIHRNVSLMKKEWVSFSPSIRGQEFEIKLYFFLRTWMWNSGKLMWGGKFGVGFITKNNFKAREAHYESMVREIGILKGKHRRLTDEIRVFEETYGALYLAQEVEDGESMDEEWSQRNWIGPLPRGGFRTKLRRGFDYLKTQLKLRSKRVISGEDDFRDAERKRLIRGRWEVENALSSLRWQESNIRSYMEHQAADTRRIRLIKKFGYTSLNLWRKGIDV